MGETDVGQGRRRGRVLTVTLAVLVLVVLLPVGVLWARLLTAPMSLPDGVQTRIESRINAAMTSGDVAVGDMVLALPQGGRAPALEFRDVVLTTPQGDVRAAFPIVRLRMAPGPLAIGQMRVKRIVIAGAGLNLTRGADGRVDLDFGGDATSEGADRTLVDTLARLDQMFASDVFSHLEEVRGEAMQVTLADSVTGRDMRLHGAEVRLTRDDGRVSLDIGGELEGSRDAVLRLNIVRDAARAVTEVGMTFDTLASRDLAAASPALAWLDLMRAPIDGELTAVLTDDGALGALSARLEVRAGEITFPGQDVPMPFDGMEAQLSYDPDTRRARFERLSIEMEQLAFDANGHADVSPDGSVFTGQFSLQDIMAHPDGLFENALAIDGAALDLRLTLGTSVQVEVGQMTIYDGDLRATARGRVIAAPEGLTLAIDAQLDRADVATVLSYWPVNGIPTTRWWVSERLPTANAFGANLALRIAPETEPLIDLSFDFAGDIIALADAPPIRGATGFLSFQGQQLSVALDGGRVGVEGQGSVDMAGSWMRIDDMTVAAPLAQFDLDLAGEVTSLMHVLAGPTFGVLDVSGYTPEEIGQGRVVGELSLAARLSEGGDQTAPEDMNVRANGIVTDFRADALIPGRTLTSDRMTITMTPAQLAVGGRAAVDGVPVTGQWSVELAPDGAPGSIVEARATIDRAALNTFGMAMPDWLVSGQGEADITVFLQVDSPARLSVRSDLDGIALAIPPIAWRKPAGRTGDFTAEIILGDRPEVRSMTLEAAGLSLDGAVTFSADGWLNRFSAGRFRVGQWLDIQGGLIGRGTDVPRIEVSGGVLDFRTMPSLSETSGSSSGDVGPLDVTLDRMQITEGIALTGLRAALDGASMSGDFRGTVNGGAQVNGQLIATANGPSVRMQSADGGAVLRSADLFENMHGGAFDLILASRPEDGQYDGRLTVDGPRLRNAPVMAELLNLISVVGLLEQLGGDGINLGEIDAAFRITPRAITLQQGTAVGPAMGFSMDGVYDVATGRYEMQGVVSPFYLVNGLMGALFATRREGLFGFNYRLIGDPEDTRVSVNPLSILTPGIFREIFRAPPPDFTQ